VGIYVRNGLNFKIRTDLENYKLKTFENIVIEVQYPNKNILISNIYRSPNPPPLTTVSDHMDNFIEILDSHLSKLSDCNSPAYVFTDSNINLFNLQTNPTCTNYIDILIINGFIQIVSKATRVQSNKKSLIDHIITNTNQTSYKAGTIVDDISDHFMNYIQLSNTKTLKYKIKESTKRQINETNMHNLKAALQNANWAGVLSDNDVNSSFNKFWEIFSSLYDLHFPKIHMRFNRNKHKINGFMNDDLLQARNKKLELHKIALKNKTQEDTQNYITQRNLYNSLLRQSKQKYYADNLRLNINNSKRTWQLLKEAANLNKPSANVEKIDKNGTIITDPTEMANEFNNFFTSVGLKISETVKPTNIKPEDYMPVLQDLQELDLGTTNQVHVCDIIKSLQSKNSMDIDGISTKLLKFLSIELSWPLAHIFNLSLINGVFPDRLKSSRTVPIFKSGRNDLCDNYRPIALLSTLSKILEKMVSVKLVNHLDRNNILYDHQYGFQRNKSTEHSIIHALNHISKAMNENKYSIGVFFDLKKAFDVCSHDILLMKLSRMGISGTALNWFKSYLSNRTQKVDINGKLSESRKIKISILQGSILGPILFLCYINDLYSVTNLLTLMYADDTFTLDSGEDLNTLITNVNAEINKIAVWFRANKLAVNISKTKYIIFRMKSKKLGPNTPDIIYNENEPDQPFDNTLITILERYHDNHENADCRSYKYLGIFLDEHLSLDTHTTHLINKLSRSLYCIKQAKHIIPLNGMKALYQSLIHSYLSHSTLIMNSITVKNKQRIAKIQKKAIRIITGSTYNAHTAPLFLQHSILPYDKLITFSQLMFMHSVEYGYAPKSFENIWLKNNDRNAERELRNANDFLLTQPRTETFKKSTFYSLPNEWNNLAPEIKLQQNRFTFKWALKAHLMEDIMEQ